MNALVIGLGAAGRRHSKILSIMGYHTYSVSNHVSEIHENFRSVQDALNARHFDYIVIANETGKHESTFEIVQSMGYRGKILIEKPLNFCNASINNEISSRTFVGFNLRYLPVINKLRDIFFEIENEIIEVNLTYGNSTDNWRTGENKEFSYSKSVNTGGGVLRDFCHEIDLACWIFGAREVFFAYGARFGDYMLDGEDYAKLILDNQSNYLVEITLDSLQKIPNRKIHIVTRDKNIEINILNGVMNINGQIYRLENSIDQTYLHMHNDILNLNSRMTARIQDGLLVDRIIRLADDYMQQNNRGGR